MVFMENADQILNFWFGNPTDPQGPYGQQRSVWFKKDAAFDDRIRQRFLPDYERAAAGDYTPWRSQPRSCLALILLLDQVPRNLFRGDARSYATDAEALAVAEAAIAQGHDQALIPVERLFMYLPLEHSEDLARQQRCVQLFETLVKEAPELASTLDYAYRHRDVIARFGRFPHRNHILGRTTTAEEAAFLQQPGSRF
jgi:uncharacterized protein (DUF924 family)